MGLVQRFSRKFRIGDRLLQTENDYGRNVFNGIRPYPKVTKRVGKSPPQYAEEEE